MRIRIVAVGRARRAPERDLYTLYRDRFDAVGRSHGLGPLKLTEVEEKRRLSPSEIKTREGELLTAALPATYVALDEHGEALTSRRFAHLLAGWRDEGLQELGFVIGGADGLSGDILKGARRTLSFGAATWPHMLERVLLAEQLYRAAALIAGHPYHRD